MFIPLNDQKQLWNSDFAEDYRRRDDDGQQKYSERMRRSGYSTLADKGYKVLIGCGLSLIVARAAIVLFYSLLNYSQRCSFPRDARNEKEISENVCDFFL